MATSGTLRPAPAAAPAAEAAAPEWLREEAARFGRYLLGAARSEELSEELVDRYARAHQHVLREPPTAADLAVLAFARAHPWSLPLLDGGTVLVRSAPLLRRKLLVMMAILEAAPEHAAATLPVAGVPLPRLLYRLGRAGAAAAIKLGAGAVLAAVVARRGRRGQGGGRGR